MGKYEVTQEEYQAIMNENPSHFKGPKLPVEGLYWSDAKEFCRKLSAKEGKTYRLPSEAEWEYACRAGTATPFHFGATSSTDQVNYDGDYPYGNGKKGLARKKPTEVGSFAANKFGLHDMHGNVLEWCEDWFNKDEYQRGNCKDPRGPLQGSLSGEVARGGGFRNAAKDCRAAARFARVKQHGDLGFRLARSSLE